MAYEEDGEAPSAANAGKDSKTSIGNKEEAETADMKNLLGYLN